jgi:polyisoprenoid-binding protein YceI
VTRSLLALLLAIAPLTARGDSYRIDPARSHIAFSVHHLLGTARGEFHKFSGTIEVDPKEPERSSVNVTIEVASIDTQIKKRDDHLISADFFNASRFPEIIFRSRSVKQTSSSSGDITGDCTMHGVTRPVTLHVKLLTPPDAARTRWSVTTDPIHRKDFALMFSGTAEAISGIGQDVSPSIEIEAVRAN